PVVDVTLVARNDGGHVVGPFAVITRGIVCQIARRVGGCARAPRRGVGEDRQHIQVSGTRAGDERIVRLEVELARAWLNVLPVQAEAYPVDVRMACQLERARCLRLQFVRAKADPVWSAGGGRDRLR